MFEWGKNLLTGLLILLLLVGIAASFVWFEWENIAPTPKPAGYQAVFKGTKIADKQLSYLYKALPIQTAQQNSRPLFLHFFSPDCPCSRFNLDHLKSLVRRYGDRIDFVALLWHDPQNPISDPKRYDFAQTYGIDIPTLADPEGTIAKAVGAYATPQAALLTNEGTLYFRGNYNLSRYCTSRETRFAEQALVALLEGKNPPDFGKWATEAYGCPLEPLSAIQ
ncbi:hypothetical protein [Hugenholtzia roseola]|uniref:DUF6436 domain-containing protein n=1 Tax=Hugenholtzia roseola TaxID=1002 RepID=UPI00040A1BCB|nr:hypothetical protein [Hugenholtzia roseola]